MNGQPEQSDDLSSELPAEAETAAGDPPSAAADSQPAEASGPQLEELQAKANENWDRYLRAAAELENVRKRAQRDVENAHKFALERFAKELLGVKDSLEMGLAAVDGASIESLIEGSNATLKLLTSTLAQFGVIDVDPAGEPFDPDFHEAISMQPAAEVEPGSVVSVVQKGYTLNGRLLRPAMVIVAADS